MTASDRDMAGRGQGRAVAGRDLRAPSVRANHRLLWLSGALGGVLGLAAGAAVLIEARADGVAHPSLLNAPLPSWLAVVLALGWLAILPIAWRWHRVVDEHERQAYRDGALAGFYVMGVGAPVWWLLWRGGMAPAVDAVWLYLAVMLVTGSVWLWRKYT